MLDIHFKNNLCIAKVIQFFSEDDVYDIIDTAEAANVEGVLLEMKTLKECSSQSPGQLMSIYKNLDEIQVKFGVTGLCETSQQFAKQARLNRFLPIFDNIEHGIQGLKKCPY